MATYKITFETNATLAFTHEIEADSLQQAVVFANNAINAAVPYFPFGYDLSDAEQYEVFESQVCDIEEADDDWSDADV